MRTVWIAEEDWGYDGTRVYGVFETEAAAQAFADSKPPDNIGHGWNVYEMPLFANIEAAAGYERPW